MWELGNRDSGDQLNWTTASSIEGAEGEYIVGSSEINSYELQSSDCEETPTVWRKLSGVVGKLHGAFRGHWRDIFPSLLHRSNTGCAAQPAPRLV